jgi:hypothetical protein
LRDILPGQGVEILARLPEMPKNAADAMLMMVASQEAAQTGVPLTFVFVSNDHGFGGAAHMLRQHGHACWRMATAVTERSAHGFDAVLSLLPSPDPSLALATSVHSVAPVTTVTVTPAITVVTPDASSLFPHVMPANLLPRPTMNLADVGQHLRRHFPEIRRQLRRISTRLSVALERVARSQGWPLRIERDGIHGCVVRRGRITQALS